uniref:Uncharacterized protein n=1 Tax=Rhizophora mucronata TaxID=61149 RepID=A0A2P2MZT8_RHIMU
MHICKPVYINVCVGVHVHIGIYRCIDRHISSKVVTSTMQVNKKTIPSPI